MSKTKIIISLEEYTELIAKAERLSAVERLLTSTEFPTTEDVKAVIDVKEKIKEFDVI